MADTAWDLTDAANRLYARHGSPVVVAAFPSSDAGHIVYVWSDGNAAELNPHTGTFKTLPRAAHADLFPAPRPAHD